jgi:hypothetical protein
MEDLIIIFMIDISEMWYELDNYKLLILYINVKKQNFSIDLSSLIN